MRSWKPATDPPWSRASRSPCTYTGWLWGGAQFDSSWDRGEPISFGIARGSLIQGWVDGIVGQPVGSKLLLSVPPEAGYGQRSMGPIPGGSTLVFAVDVLAAK